MNATKIRLEPRSQNGGRSTAGNLPPRSKVGVNAINALYEINALYAINEFNEMNAFYAFKEIYEFYAINEFNEIYAINAVDFLER
jgi:hypothetical protein